MDTTILKVNKGISKIKNLLHGLPRKSFATIYKTFLRPQTNYGDIIYEQPQNEFFCEKKYISTIYQPINLSTVEQILPSILFFIYPKWLAQSRRSLEIKDAFYYLLQRHHLPYHHMDLINSANLAFDNFESLSGNNKKDAFYRDEKRK